MKNPPLKVITIFFVLSLGLNIYYLRTEIHTEHPNPPVSTIAMAHSAQKEIGCPCCDKNIADCKCGMAGPMRNTVDKKTEELFQKDPRNLTQEKILLEAGKEFGMDTIISKELRQKLKAELTDSAPEERPKITIEPESYDFGEIIADNGVQETSFKLKNEGSQPLVIKGINSSCGCTTAKIIYQNEESPVFGMHKKTNWTTSISQGDTAELIVMYDPNHHPDFTGDATRVVTIINNDPIDSKKEVKISLNQK